MAARKMQPGPCESQSCSLGAAPGAWVGVLGAGAPRWELRGTQLQLPRPECLSFADQGVFCPELLLWVVSDVHDS